MIRRPPRSTPFPTRRSSDLPAPAAETPRPRRSASRDPPAPSSPAPGAPARRRSAAHRRLPSRSEEHTSELQSRSDLVCRLLLEKKNTQPLYYTSARHYTLAP